MIHPLAVSLLGLLLASTAHQSPAEQILTPQQAGSQQLDQAACPGTTALPPAWVDKFEPVEDQALLAKALGEPNKGGLCEGQVYRSKAGAQITIHRVWNSTNPGSTKGDWWAFDRPSGAVARYRSDYDICYQWTPLDRLVSCDLKAGAKIVVGPGQSARCSDFVTHPASAKRQIFIDDAPDVVTNCTTYRAEFSWQRIDPAPAN